MASLEVLQLHYIRSGHHRRWCYKQRPDVYPCQRGRDGPDEFCCQWSYHSNTAKDQFEAFIQGDKYLRTHRGRFAERNGARAPFTNIVDANIQQDFMVKTKGVTHTLSVRLDIFNLTNLIDKNAGRQYFFSFDQAQVLNVASFTGTTPNYRFNAPQYNKVGAISDGTSAFENSSRWNGQLTIRYSF